jgi:cation diffusion facilitator family transporter
MDGMEKRRRQQETHSGIYRIIMLVLLKEGPLTLSELEEKTTLLSLHFSLPQSYEHRHNKRRKEPMKVVTACNNLVGENLVCVKGEKYELTEAGKAKAEYSSKRMDRGANVLENQLLSPSAAARNTIVTYIFLAAMKLFAGLFGGSVGLIADGADTTVDTASAGVVWLGIRFKKELLGTIAIIALMFGTAATLVYGSATSILENVNGTFVPMTHPILIIAVEGIALLCAFGFSYYQRFVGKRSRSLALISQSIDSKKAVNSAAAVIVGAAFSIFGIFWVDAVAGGFIAARITWDSFGLTRQAYNSLKGEKTDFSKFKMPFEDKIRTNREETFRNWVLYAVHESKTGTRQEIMAWLEKTFKPMYMPSLFSEFAVGRDYDFKSRFPELVKPLLAEAYLEEKNGVYVLTEKGKVQVQTVLSNLRYLQTEL